MDEKPFYVGEESKVLTFKKDHDTRPQPSVQQPLRAHYSFIFGISAVGDFTRPALLLPLKTLPDETEPFLGRIAFYPTSTGYIQTPSLLKWTTEIFLKKVDELRSLHGTANTPFLLLMDNHATRLDSNFLTTLSQHNITLFTFPPNSTFVLQPLDLVFNGVFQNHFQRLYQIPKVELGIAGERTAVFSAASDAFQLSCMNDTITGSFVRSGVHPLDECEPLTNNAVISGPPQPLAPLRGDRPDIRARELTDLKFIDEVVMWESKK